MPYSLKPAGNNSAHIPDIPNHMAWMVTMWHFGQDSITGHNGEMFDPLEEGSELFRKCSKKRQGGKSKRIRKEKQEYHAKPLGEAFMDKMKEGADDEHDGGPLLILLYSMS